MRRLRNPLAVGQPIRGVVARAEVEDLSRSHEVVERAERLLFGRVDVLHVDLIEVDAVRLEPPQAVFDRSHDTVAGRAGSVRSLAHAEAELGREHHAVTTLGLRHPGAHDALGQPVLAVDVGGVDEAHAASSARFMIANEVFSSHPTLCMNDFSSASPKVMAPRQSTGTLSPLFPSDRYSMASLSPDGWGRENSSGSQSSAAIK